MDNVIDFPTPKEKRDAEREYRERVERSSEVREIPREDFDRIRREHEEAVIRQALLRRQESLF